MAVFSLKWESIYGKKVFVLKQNVGLAQLLSYEP